MTAVPAPFLIFYHLRLVQNYVHVLNFRYVDLKLEFWKEFQMCWSLCPHPAKEDTSMPEENTNIDHKRMPTQLPTCTSCVFPVPFKLTLRHATPLWATIVNRALHTPSCSARQEGYTACPFGGSQYSQLQPTTRPLVNEQRTRQVGTVAGTIGPDATCAT